MKTLELEHLYTTLDALYGIIGDIDCLQDGSDRSKNEEALLRKSYKNLPRKALAVCGELSVLLKQMDINPHINI